MSTGGQEDNMTREQETQGDTRTGGQEDRTCGTIHWLTCIPIDVHVLHPAALLLKLLITQISKKFHLTNYFNHFFLSNCGKGEKDKFLHKPKENPNKSS